jgi:hypothetical protein
VPAGAGLLTLRASLLRYQPATMPVTKLAAHSLAAVPFSMMFADARCARGVPGGSGAGMERAALILYFARRRRPRAAHWSWCRVRACRAWERAAGCVPSDCSCYMRWVLARGCHSPRAAPRDQGFSAPRRQRQRLQDAPPLPAESPATISSSRRIGRASHAATLGSTRHCPPASVIALDILHRTSLRVPEGVSSRVVVAGDCTAEVAVGLACAME